MKFAVEKHWDKIAAGFAINEGGCVVTKDGKYQYVGVQTSEKVMVNVDVIAKGTSGHGSVPRPDNAVVHLAAAIAKIGAYETPVQFNSVTRAYFGGLAPIEDDETSKWMRALESPDRGDHAARWVANANPTWNSMLRDTISPTMLQAGVRQNVIPSEARGVLNIRLLPGNMLDPLLGKLQQLVNDPQIRFEVDPGAGESRRRRRRRRTCTIRLRALRERSFRARRSCRRCPRAPRIRCRSGLGASRPTGCCRFR